MACGDESRSFSLVSIANGIGEVVHQSVHQHPQTNKAKEKMAQIITGREAEVRTYLMHKELSNLEHHSHQES